MKSGYTIKDIARMAGVSHTTVSRALNGEKYVRADTYARIMEICRKTGYTPNAIAGKLKSSRSKTFGVLVPDIGNVYFSSVVRQFELRAHTHGYQVFISSSFYDYQLEEKAIQTFLQNRLDGIVVSGAGSRSAKKLLPFANQVPMVFIGDNIPMEGVSYVTADNKRGTAMATQYLYDLGHRRFAFVGGRGDSITHQLRIAGFEETLREKDIDDYLLFSVNNGSQISHGYETGVAYFMQKNNQATAVLTISSLFALGFNQAAAEHGRQTPEDYSLIGFDDNPFAALPQIGLSTISQSEEQTVESAFDILQRMMEREISAPESRVIAPALVIRKTCARQD